MSAGAGLGRAGRAVAQGRYARRKRRKLVVSVGLVGSYAISEGEEDGRREGTLSFFLNS